MNPSAGEHRLPDESDSAELFRIPLSCIDFEPQVRHAFPVTSHERLTGSIRAVGVLEPILVRPRGDRYGLVFGERRVRATAAAGLTHIPSLVQHLTDDQVLRLRLAENLQREALCLLDRVEALWAFKVENRYTWNQIGEELNTSVSHAKALAGLRKLPSEVKQAIYGGLSTGMALALRAAPAEIQPELLRRAMKEGMTAKDAWRIVKAHRTAGNTTTHSSEEVSDHGGRAAAREALEAMERLALLLGAEDRERLRNLITRAGTKDS